MDEFVAFSINTYAYCIKNFIFYILAKYLFLIKTKKYDIKKTKKVDGYGWIRMIIDHNCQCD
jgi:hypothetical protein